MVPFKDNGHLTAKQIKYNITLAATRVTIERAFALLKNRWRRLFYLELHCSDRLPDTILAACILHNVCIRNNDELPTGDIENNDPYIQDEANDCIANNAQNREGMQKRNYIADHL